MSYYGGLALEQGNGRENGGYQTTYALHWRDHGAIAMLLSIGVECKDQLDAC